MYGSSAPEVKRGRLAHREKLRRPRRRPCWIRSNIFQDRHMSTRHFRLVSSTCSLRLLMGIVAIIADSSVLILRPDTGARHSFGHKVEINLVFTTSKPSPTSMGHQAGTYFSHPRRIRTLGPIAVRTYRTWETSLRRRKTPAGRGCLSAPGLNIRTNHACCTHIKSSRFTSRRCPTKIGRNKDARLMEEVRNGRRDSRIETNSSYSQAC